MVVRRIATDVAFGFDTSVFVGPGLEYASSRPYQPGDSTRSLNWRLTGRRGRPFVKEYEVLRRVSIYVLVDTSASMAVSSIATSKLDCAVWVAAAIGLVGLRRMTPVAVTGLSQTIRRPSLRATDLWLTLDAIRSGGRRHVDLSTALGRIEAAAPCTSLVIVISDFHDATATQGMIRCALRHDCMALRIVDPAERGGLCAGFFNGCESESDRMFLGHSRTRWEDHTTPDREMLSAGVDVLALSTDEPLASGLRRFLESRGGHARR